MKIMNRLFSRYCFSALIALTTITLCHCASSAVAAIPAPDGLVGWWKGESNVVDAIGGANGYETNGAGYGAGKVGMGFNLDGVDDRVVVPNPSSLNFGSNQNFSVEAWIQAQPTPDNYNGVTSIASKVVTPDPSRAAGWSLHMVNGRLGFQMLQVPISSESHWTSTNPNLQDGHFHHVAVTVDRTSPTGGRLYVDGIVVLNFDPTQNAGDLSTAGPLNVGCHDNPTINTFFKGIIDEVSIYNRELTSAEIGTVYQSDNGGKSMAPAAPAIVAQPASQQVGRGNNVTLEVGVVGTQPLMYKWFFNGTHLTVTTNNFLTVSNFQTANEGSYHVLVSNAIGSVTSSNALLTLRLPMSAPPGLVGWWKGEGNVVDGAGNANGYVTNGAGYGAGVIGTGFNLDGISNRVVVPNATSLNFGTNQDFSMEVWIQAQPTPGNYLGYTVIADKAYPRDASSVVGWMFYLRNGRPGFLMSQAPMTTGGASYWEASSPNLQDGQFHHLAVTVDRSSTTGGRLYVDGVVVLTFNPVPEIGNLSSAAPLRIGNHNNPDLKCNFKGIIDELSVYNRELTSLDITAIYQTSGAGKVVQPLAPVIITQPASQQVVEGNNVTIEVGVVGTQQFLYRWFLNETNLTVTTNNLLTVGNFQAANEGAYKVVVSNGIGSTTSSNALLTLRLPLSAPQGLVGWWRGESNVVDDVSGLSGYTTNGAGFGPGEVGAGFSFDGVNDRVIVPNASALNFGSNQNFSVETWIQPQSTPLKNFYGTVDIAVKASTPDSTRSVGWALYLQSGRLCFQMSRAPMASGNVSQWSSSGPNLLDGRFHHVAATVNRTSKTGGRLYVDGILVRSFDPTPENGDLSTDGPLFIGGADNSALNVYFKGMIDEVSIYNRELASNEIAAVYQASEAGKAVQPFAPVITTQPASQQVVQGNNVTFGVGITGTPPFTYQWRVEGSNIFRATNSSLAIHNVQPKNAGNYTVVIGNGAGSVTSSNALLTIVSPLPVSQGLIGWWRGESNAVDAVSLTSGIATNGAGYGPAKVGAGFSFDGVNDRVVIPNAPALNFGPNQNFSMETWIQSQTVPANYYNIAIIAAKSSAPDVTQCVGWQLYLQYGRLGFLMATPPMSPANYTAWVAPGPNVQDGKFHHVAVTVDRASHTGGKMYVDGSLAMTFDPTPRAGDLSTDGPLYLGSHDNPTINSYFKGMIDEFSLYNRELAATEIGAIYQASDLGKVAQPLAPFIAAQPSGRQVVLGTNVILEVGAGGTQPLAYQWRFNGNNMEGGTNSSLILTNIQFAQAGSYSVKVSNDLGSVTSSNALLRVDYPPAMVRVADANGSAGVPITVPVLLLANGNENAVSFSVDFDPSMLTFANVVAGSGAAGGSLLPNTNLVGSGKLGLILALRPGSVFSKGTQEIVKVIFNVATTLAGSTPVTLGDQPTLRQLSDVQPETLPANYEKGTVTFAAADFEGDVSPRPTGDKTVTLIDWVQEGRYVARLDNPASASEYQRADCAPQSTRGDGAITVLDWVQVGRYAVGLDPVVPVGGPSADIFSIGTLGKATSHITASGPGCEVRILEMHLVQGRSGTVSVVLEAQGTETALTFSLAFDPAVISFLNASPGSAAAGAIYNVNTNEAGSGRVGFGLSLSAGQTFGTGAKEILKLNVQAAASAPVSQSSFKFTDQPIPRGVSDVTANLVNATYTQGVLNINSSIPTLQISRFNDQVVLSWPDWATNYVLQATGNGDTNLNWTNSVATSTLTNGQCAVTLPASSQTELYRLIQSGAQTGGITPLRPGSTNPAITR